MTETFDVLDKSTWAVPGGVLVGLGIGFFFLPGAPLAFVGGILGGVGLGFLVTAILCGALIIAMTRERSELR